jgi:hypothetical protein
MTSACCRPSRDQTDPVLPSMEMCHALTVRGPHNRAQLVASGLVCGVWRSLRPGPVPMDVKPRALSTLIDEDDGTA